MVTLAAGAALALGARALGARAALGAGTLGTGAALGARALRARSAVGTRATVRARSAVGARATVGTRATVGAGAAIASVSTVSTVASIAAVSSVSSVSTLSAVTAHTAVASLGATAVGRAGILGAAGDLSLVALSGGTPGVLPRLVDDVTVLASIAVSGDEEVVVVVPVLALLRLVDSKTVAAAVGAVLGDVLRSTLARAGLRDVDELALAVLTGVTNEDIDNLGTAAVLGVALAVVADVDGSDGLGGSGSGIGDGGGEGGGQGRLVSDGSGEDIGDGDIRAVDSDVDSEADGVRDGLAGLDAAAAGKRSITTTELRVVTGALDVTLVGVDTAGVVTVNLVTGIALLIVNTEVSTALSKAGAEVEVHGARGLEKLEGREAIGGTDTAEEGKVADGAREARSRCSRRSGLSASLSTSLGASLSASGLDGLALGVGGSTLGVGSSSLGLSASLGAGRLDGLARGVGGSALRVGVGRLNGASGVSRIAATVTAARVAGAWGTDSKVGDLELGGGSTARLNELDFRGATSGRCAVRRLGAGSGGETLGEDALPVGSDIKSAVGLGTLLGLNELDQDLPKDDEQVSGGEAGEGVVGDANGERSNAIGAGDEGASGWLEFETRDRAVVG